MPGNRIIIFLSYGYNQLLTKSATKRDLPHLHHEGDNFLALGKLRKHNTQRYAFQLKLSLTAVIRVNKLATSS